MAIQIQYRRGTAAEWTAANPTLATGEPGYETDTGKFKVGDGSTAWTSLAYSSGIQGIQGIQGDQGIQGIQGIQGLKGDTGDTGPQGLKGDTGDTGPQGIQGIKGDTGNTGPTGPQGIQGVKGDTGDTGPQGPQGPAGPVQSVNGQTGAVDLSSVYQPLDADLTSIAGLAGTTGLLKKTAANTWSLDTTAYGTGTVTSVGGTGTVSGLSLSGTVTSSGNLTLSGTLSVTPSNFASQTANQILAAPDMFGGVPSFRALTSADLPSTLINKTFTGYTETVYNLSGTAIIPANGTIQYKTLSANTTFTESLADGQSVTLMINPSTYTATWPSVTWIGAVSGFSPTLAASVYNCIVLFQFNSVLYGKYEGQV